VTKTINTSRYVQLITLPTTVAALRQYIGQRAPTAKLLHALHPLPAAPATTFTYLDTLDNQTGTQRRKHLQKFMNAQQLQQAVDWSAIAVSRLTPLTIRLLTPWLTHHAWQPLVKTPQHSAAPLVACIPYPRPSLYLSLDPPTIISLRARLRARRALTEEHRHRLEKPTIGPPCAPYCVHSICQTAVPQPPDDTIEHIMLHCPSHAQLRAQLLAAIRTVTNLPTITLSLPLVLGEVTDLPHHGHSRHCWSSVLQLTASYYRDVEGQRRHAALRPFEPP
jgi:hypothetical protein